MLRSNDAVVQNRIFRWFDGNRTDIRFSWKCDGDGFQPVSESDFLNQDGISLLDCILMDSGGLPYSETIPWLDEGLKRSKSVKAGELEYCDWSRETWGVVLRKGQAKIYSLHDAKYFQSLSLCGFTKVLQEWIAFIQSKPDAREQATVNFSLDEPIH